MAWTGYYDHGNTTDTTYAKPLPHSATPAWGTDVVTETKNSADQRQRSYASLADGTRYNVLKQAGGSPASTDVVLSTIEASADQIAIASNASTAATQATTAATQATAAATDAATAAAEVVKIHRAASAVTAGGASTRTKTSASETVLVEVLS